MSAGDLVDYGAIVTRSDGEEDAPASLAVNPWDGIRRYTSAREVYEFPVAVIVGLSEKEQLAASSGHAHVYLLPAATASALVILLTGILGSSSWQLVQPAARKCSEGRPCRAG